MIAAPFRRAFKARRSLSPAFVETIFAHALILQYEAAFCELDFAMRGCFSPLSVFL